MKKFFLIALASILITYGYSDNNNFIDVSYENLEVNSESVENTTTFVDGNIDFDIILGNPGDFYEFTVDLVNNSQKDYFISKIDKGLSTEEEQNYIKYDITYSDGTSLKEQDVIKGHSKEKIKARITYYEELPVSIESIPLNFNIVLSE